MASISKRIFLALLSLSTYPSSTLFANAQVTSEASDNIPKPTSHSSVAGQLLVTYKDAPALDKVKKHVSDKKGQGRNVSLKTEHNFSRPQKSKGKRTNRGGGGGGGRGGGRVLQEEVASAGYVVIVTDESTTSIEMDELLALPGVLSVEQDSEMIVDGWEHLLRGSTSGGDNSDSYNLGTLGSDESSVPKKDINELHRHLQNGAEVRPWGIDLVNVTQLWNLTPANPIKICVIDTGYDLGHVDLPSEGVAGWDTGNANNGVWNVDGHGHGTHCAGSIGAIGENNEGVVGVNPDPSKFSFFIAKGLSDSGSGAGGDVLDAVSECVAAGAKVISMSLGCDNCFSQASENFYQDIYDQDVLVIAAAGNSGSDIEHFPSGYSAVMSVASVTQGQGPDSPTYGQLSGFSTRNDQTEISGPGSSVLSTVPGDNYATFSGTSMATPHVAGVAALLWSLFPECTNNQIRNAMIHSKREPPSEEIDPRNTPGWDKFYGWGIVDAGHAHHILSSQGCENAGGASPGDGQTLSEFALGGRFQLDVGCFNDAHCAAAADDVCAGEMRCNTVDHTCFQVQESGGFCDDNDPCTDDVCDPTRDIITGLEDLCVNTPKVCGDGNVCNGVFSCEANTGECILDAPPIDCSDGDACSVDTCDPTREIINGPEDLCVHTTVDCNSDGNVCDGTHVCDSLSGECVLDTPAIDCSDNDPCTIDTCDPISGICSNTPVVCDDDNVCNGVFTCEATTGNCIPNSPPITCEQEGDVCQLGQCDTITGECSFVPRVCDDFNACTLNDRCDPIEGCVFQDVEVDCCGNGVCEAGAGEDTDLCPVDCEPIAPIGPPVHRESFPHQDDLITGNTVTISATVFDDNIQNVRFQIQNPNGSTTNFQSGIQTSTLGDLTTWTFEVSTLQKGSYGFRIEMRDEGGNIVIFPDTSLAVERRVQNDLDGHKDGGGGGGGGNNGDFIEFLVIDTLSELVDVARENINQAIRNFQGGNLAAKFVRMGFHDCVGGCDGCIDLTNPDNEGLLPPIEALQPIVERFSHFGITRADLWVLAALEGARDSQTNGDNLPFEMTFIGRPNCEDLNAPGECVEQSCFQTRGPHRDLPGPNLDTHELLEFFRLNFDFQEPWETVAIMGAHTIGSLVRENSGFNGTDGWLGNNVALNNGYYDSLVGGSATDFQSGNFEAMMNAADWQQVFINNTDVAAPHRYEWERQSNPHFVMLNADLALVRDFSNGLIDDDEGQVSQCQFRCNRNGGAGCPLPRCPHAVDTFDIAAEYKHDNDKFLQDFQAAFSKVLNTGDFDTTEGCESAPCTLKGVAWPWVVLALGAHL